MVFWGERMLLIRFMGWFGILFAFCSPLRAASDAPLSDLWLYYSEDEKNATDTNLALNLAIGQDDLLQLSVGEAQSEFTTRIATQELTTNRYMIGYNTLRPAPWNLNVFYEYWGKDSELVIHTYGMDLDYLFTNWTLGMSLEYRDISLYTRETLLSVPSKTSSDSYGIGLLIVKDWDKTSWSLSGRRYDYSDDPTQLFSVVSLLKYGGRTISRTTALEDWHAKTGVTHRFTDLTLGFRYNYSVSAVEQAVSQTVSASMDYDFGKNFTLTLEWGRIFADPTTRVPESTQTDYGLIGLGLHF